MSEWFFAFLQSSSPFFLLALIPFLVLMWVKRPRARMPIPWLQSMDKGGVVAPTFTTIASRVVLGSLVVVLVLTLVSPGIPVLKTVVVESQQQCARDVVVVLDISGSMNDTFDAAVEALHTFARGRDSDCFTTILFSGPTGMSYPENKRGYALMVNSQVQDPDALLLALAGGLDGTDPSSQLRQFSKGTQISEGLFLADAFLREDSQANAQVLLLISDLGNDPKDDARSIEIIQALVEREVAVLVFGVGVGESFNKLRDEISALSQGSRVEYFPIESANDFTRAYSLIDKLKPSTPPRTQTEIVSVQKVDRVLWWVALGLFALWVVLVFYRKRIP